jgi:hypothetical protein
MIESDNAQIMPNLFIVLIVVVKAFTGDSLASAPRTRFKIAAQQVQRASQDPTVVAGWKLQIVSPLPVADPIILLTIYYELGRRAARPVFAGPTGFL